MTGHSRKRRATSADGRAGQRARTDAAGPNAAGPDAAGPDSSRHDAAAPDAAGPSFGVPTTLDDGRKTPESRPDLLAMQTSGSPTRVSGREVAVGTRFAECDSATDPCKVDKSLVCIGFWESVKEVGRICLPRRSGKTYNLTQLLLFFSSSLELDYVEDIPNSMIPGTDSEMDIAALCRKKRECLFKDSLLQTMHRKFYAEHFMKYPVLYISLSKCKGASFGTFIRALCHTIANVAQKWIEEIKLVGTAVSDRARHPFEQLKRRLQSYESAIDLPENQMASYTDLAKLLFQMLSTFIAKQFGRYLLLIDEYDIPFISIHLAKWSDEDKQAALEVMKALFQDMLKDNNNLRKGLLFGVFEIPLTEMGSGANNIMDIHMIPTEESDIQVSLLLAPQPHSGRGMDALTDSFWFNAHEVEKMLDNSALQCTHIAKHKTLILRTIREWYNGYYIGRFRGKYNPWSVNSFIAAMYNLLSHVPTDKEVDIATITKSAAKAYWVKTGTTGLIEAQIDRHRPQFIHLAKRLLCEYEATKSQAPGNSQGYTSSEPLQPPVPLVSTRLSLMNFDGEQFSESGLLTLCLYAGYLTRRLSTSVCIPNHEVYQVWLQLFARAVLGTELADNSTNNACGALISELWHNKTDLLCTLATSSHGVLSNHNNYLENDYANHVANTIMAVSQFGMLTHPSQRTVEVSHVVLTRESHAGNGRCDYAMRLFSSTNQPNQFGVIIEFKLIENNRREDTAYHWERAEEGLCQIGIKNYDACLVGCLERMDIGMAIGNSAAYAVSKLFRRPNAHARWEEVDSLF
ncbi:hypothetical protein FBU31_001203 [Coemansia sp. 'formosensis']|nr:hypothetical protein FBU31_001203 [Coemansia sp. 'formosensis']